MSSRALGGGIDGANTTIYYSAQLPLQLQLQLQRAAAAAQPAASAAAIHTISRRSSPCAVPAPACTPAPSPLAPRRRQPGERPSAAWARAQAHPAAAPAGALNDYQKDQQFRKLNAQKDKIMVKVIRGGQQMLVENVDVVCGDLLMLDTGDKIIADGILIETFGLVIDEASLTGESDPIKKNLEEDPWCRCAAPAGGAGSAAQRRVPGRGRRRRRQERGRSSSPQQPGGRACCWAVLWQARR